MANDSRALSRRAVLGGIAATGIGMMTVMTPGSPSTAASDRDFDLAVDGQTMYRIYLGSGEGPVVQQAANELAHYLNAVTGATFPVIMADQPPDYHYLLVVGKNNTYTGRAARSVNFSALGEDGFTLSTSGNSIFIAGDIPRGTLYGVYWLLDHLVGVRWYADDYTVVPQRPTLAIPNTALNSVHVPRFRYRLILAGDANNSAYRQHNLLNGLRDQYWALPRPAGIDTWSHYWPEEIHGSFHEVVTDQTLWHGGQLKVMDPATRAAAAASLITTIRRRIANGQDASAPFYQEDTSWTPDPASQQFADAHGGSLAAPVIDMLNDVIARVRQEIPQARIETQAYQMTFPPPTGISVSDGIVLTVAPIHANFGHSHFSVANQAIADAIPVWATLSSDIVLWDYLTTFSCFIQPFPDWFAAAQSIKTLANYPSAQGCMGQGAHLTAGAEMANLRIWTLSRLLWDPTLDIDVLIREFLTGYYGAAADNVFAYMQLMRNSVHATNTNLTMLVTVTSPYLNFQTMRQADELLAAAEQLVMSNPEHRAHLREIRLGVDYVILLRRAEFLQIAQQQGINWTPDTQNRIARFDAELTASGLTVSHIGGGTPAQLKAQVRIERSAPTPPATVAGLPPSDWVDFQDSMFRLYAPITTTVEDVAASDRYTVRMPGSANAWGVQFPLYMLPPEGTWKLYVSVRVDTGTAEPAANAFVAGVYPPFDNDIKVPVSQMSDGLYHEVALPGVYTYDASGRYAFAAPPFNPAVTAVFVDRIFAVRT